MPFWNACISVLHLRTWITLFSSNIAKWVWIVLSVRKAIPQLCRHETQINIKQKDITGFLSFFLSSFLPNSQSTVLEQAPTELRDGDLKLILTPTGEERTSHKNVFLSDGICRNSLFDSRWVEFVWFVWSHHVGQHSRENTTSLIVNVTF